MRHRLMLWMRHRLMLWMRHRLVLQVRVLVLSLMLWRVLLRLVLRVLLRLVLWVLLQLVLWVMLRLVLWVMLALMLRLVLRVKMIIRGHEHLTGPSAHACWRPRILLILVRMQVVVGLRVDRRGPVDGSTGHWVVVDGHGYNRWRMAVDRRDTPGHGCRHGWGAAAARCWEFFH